MGVVGSAVAKRRVAACHRDAMKIYEQPGTRGMVESNDSCTTTFSTMLIIVLRTSDLSSLSLEILFITCLETSISISNRL